MSIIFNTHQPFLIIYGGVIMNEIDFINYLWFNDKIGCCQYIIDLIVPILSKSKITKDEYHFILSVLNLCNLIYRENKDDQLAKDIRNTSLTYYTILFNKTIDR